MQRVKVFLIIILTFISRLVSAQDSSAIQQYINTYRDIAIEEMQRTGVPASVKLAQGIHETLAGTSDLVKKSNNHFGIKCKDSWAGESVKHDDDLRNECFRKYNSAEESYRDHSDFLKNSSRYAPLFSLDPVDYKSWAYGLKKAGYATNPRYPQIIIKLIEDYHLQDYTMIALGKMQPKEEIVAKVTVDIPKKQTEPLTVAVKTADPVFLDDKKNEPAKAEIKLQETKEPVIKTQDKIAEEKPRYPEGEFKINETRVMYAKKGTSFLAIAQQYNVSLAWLFEFNDMTEKEATEKDQLIYLQRKRKTGNNEFHSVKPGETLYDIAQEEAIRIESLLEYNLLSNGMQPAIGEQLYLRTKTSAKPKLVLKDNYSINSIPGTLAMSSNPVNSGNTTEIPKNSSETNKETANFILYTVQSKETIWAIAQKNKVKTEDIVKWNQLQSHDLKAGQQIKIYK
jgi:LysM repeat protein